MHSFLNLNEQPLRALPDTLGPEWLEWEVTAKRIPELLSSGSLRSKVDHELPALHFCTIQSSSPIVLERVYTMLCFIAHAYIRGAPGDEMIRKLPRKIAQVWVDVSRALDLPPISTYASTVVFNLQFDGNPKSLDDLRIVFTSTGLKDEEWFYLVSAGIDLESEHVIKIAEGIRACSDIDACLMNLKEVIERLTTVLNRMYEHCSPDAFYFKVRRFFAGWLNDPELEGKGLLYELDSGDTYFNLAGGSAAQTATIQLIDIILGINHDKTDGQETFVHGKVKVPYLKEMRSYMPVSHRQYLQEGENFFSQPSVCKSIKGSPAYSACIEALTKFRNAHIIMVTRYIISQAAKSKQTALGTGGSNPLPFLKQFRDDTKHHI